MYYRSGCVCNDIHCRVALFLNYNIRRGCVIHYEESGETDTIEYDATIRITDIWHTGIDGHDIIIYRFDDGSKTVIHDPDCWCLPYLSFVNDTIDYN